jgi:ABC-type glycerol-3-phosphate transport system permease component
MVIFKLFQTILVTQLLSLSYERALHFCPSLRRLPFNFKQRDKAVNTNTFLPPPTKPQRCVLWRGTTWEPSPISIIEPPSSALKTKECIQLSYPQVKPKQCPEASCFLQVYFLKHLHPAMSTAQSQRSVNTVLTTVLVAIVISLVRSSSAAYEHSFFNRMSEG